MSEFPTLLFLHCQNTGLPAFRDDASGMGVRVRPNRVDVPIVYIIDPTMPGIKVLDIVHGRGVVMDTGKEHSAHSGGLREPTRVP